MKNASEAQLNKALGLISLAKKAGKISGGAFQVEQSVKSGKARLVLIAGDTSERSLKHYKDICTFYEVELECISNMETLGHSVGTEFRSALSVNDEGFAKALLKQIRSKDMGGSSIDGKKNQ